MEFSVLWAVFPLLDQLIESTPIRLGLTAFSYGMSVIAAVGGILLRKGEFHVNGMYASALIGLTVFIVGLIIIRLTPQERSKR
jgi:hypothetical protein